MEVPQSCSKLRADCEHEDEDTTKSIITNNIDVRKPNLVKYLILGAEANVSALNNEYEANSGFIEMN